MKRLFNTGALISLFCAAVILTVFSEKASDFAREALKVCALCVVPSVFPYMVISHMTVSCGIAHRLGRILPLSRIFSLPSCATAPILLGALCGFPVGAKCACQMYLQGDITKEECEVLISLANNTGPSFVVSVIGASFFHSALFGWQLYFFQLLSSFLSALLINRIVFPFGKRKDIKDNEIPRISTFSFSRAVSDSCSSTVTVCGFIVFFSVISGFIVDFAGRYSLDAAALIAAIAEFSKGTAHSATLGGIKGRFLCGLSLGFSGLCVFSQTYAITSPHGISLKRTVATKLIQGVLTGIMAAFIPPVLSDDILPVSLPSLFSLTQVFSISSASCSLISLFLCIFSIKNITKE